MFTNSGQSCYAPARMFAPKQRSEDVNAIAKESASKFTVGDPADEVDKLGPVESRAQYDKIQNLIQSGIDQGAQALIGTGRPEHLNRGYYIRPTVFADVTQEMRSTRAEVFGP